jgi:hypothetical protein
MILLLLAVSLNELFLPGSGVFRYMIQNNFSKENLKHNFNNGALSI